MNTAISLYSIIFAVSRDGTVSKGNEWNVQAIALVNACYKYKIDLNTNGVVETDVIKFVHSV